MKKIKNGSGGEITADMFRKIFPDKPEIFLMDFIRSDFLFITLVVEVDREDILMSSLSKVTALRLLDELRGK